MTQPHVFYPVARGQDGVAIHIDDWQPGQEVTCFGCSTRLVGHLPHDGIKPTAHFAHKDDVECDDEKALQQAAKAAIVHAHAKGVLQTLSWECPLCRRQPHLTNLSSLAFVEDVPPCEGIVSDVLGSDAAGQALLAIEVVVTHDIEAETLDQYHACGLAVFSLQPSWGSIADITRGACLIVDHRAGVVDRSSCAGCQEIIREKCAWDDLDRARKANQWGDLWITLWRSVGREVLAGARAHELALHQQATREDAWWLRWSAIWPRIGEHIIDLWWTQWHQLWIDLGVEYMRPYRWSQRWLDAWDLLGRQYAADEIERERQRRYWVDRRDEWWTKWLRMWKDIGQRESGAMAAWRPICRKCRDDLRPDHRCPRADALAVR